MWHSPCPPRETLPRSGVRITLRTPDRGERLTLRWTAAVDAHPVGDGAIEGRSVPDVGAARVVRPLEGIAVASGFQWAGDFEAADPSLTRAGVRIDRPPAESAFLDLAGHGPGSLVADVDGAAHRAVPAGL